MEYNQFLLKTQRSAKAKVSLRLKQWVTMQVKDLLRAIAALIFGRSHTTISTICKYT